MSLMNGERTVVLPCRLLHGMNINEWRRENGMDFNESDL